MKIFELAGIILILFAASHFLKGLVKRVTCKNKTSGELAYIYDTTEVGTDKQTHTVYSPVYAYVVDDVTYEAKAAEYSYDMGKYKKGSKATILYNPNNPKECIVNGKTGELYVSFLLTIFGIILVLIGR